MKNEFPFRRGNFGGSSESLGAPDPQFFAQVPTMFTQGLSPEQWKALQETYRIAWERARAQRKDDSLDVSGSSYEI